MPTNGTRGLHEVERVFLRDDSTEEVLQLFRSAKKSFYFHIAGIRQVSREFIIPTTRSDDIQEPECCCRSSITLSPVLQKVVQCEHVDTGAVADIKHFESSTVFYDVQNAVGGHLGLVEVHTSNGIRGRPKVPDECVHTGLAK
ncbi:hypothetical protein HK102_008567, partial [Quaeritorhiza haematococci]